MKFIKLFIILTLLFLYSCSTVRESAGVARKNIDDFKVIENPPLVIPPDFNLLPPEQLKEKNINDVEKDLAQEILFGLDQNENKSNKRLSTMNDILSNINETDISPSFREEFDREFSQEFESNSIFQIDWETEFEVLNAVKESERIRNKIFEGESLKGENVPIIKQVIKKKKKKRFFFF